jgi:hypothetical protein
MASTYVNDLRLNELGTGDASGTWGTITNLNLELIGEGLSFATQDCFTTDADATTTIADGASDPARAMYFKVTSSATLTATRTLTIAPNTVSRLQFIENATTGGQSINISQGSGSNVTIPTGATKAVYLDGGGATAAVTDAFADLNVGTIDATTLQIGGTSVTATAAELNYNDVTTLGTVEVSKVVTADANGDVLFPDNENLKFGTGGDLQIYHDGSNSHIVDSGTGNFNISATNFNVYNAAGTEQKIGATSDGSVDLYYDSVKKFETTSTGVAITGSATADGDAVKVAGTETIWIPANSMYPNTTNGCASITQVELSNGPEIKVLDFDPSSDENAQFSIAFPKSWNEGTITFKVFFTVTGTDTGTVAWGLSGVAIADDGSIDTAFGTNVVATAKAHSGTSNDLDVTAESGAVTIAGSPAAGEQVFFQIMRDVSADTQTGDARLLGIQLFFTTDAANDE